MKSIQFKNAQFIFMIETDNLSNSTNKTPLYVFEDENNMIISIWKMSFLERLKTLFYGKVKIQQNKSWSLVSVAPHISKS